MTSQKRNKKKFIWVKLLISVILKVIKPSETPTWFSGQSLNFLTFPDFRLVNTNVLFYFYHYIPVTIVIRVFTIENVNEIRSSYAGNLFTFSKNEII